MHALVWEGPRQLFIREHPNPQPAAGEVVVAVHYAGICGSELSGYLGHNALRVPPLVMGHEFSGEIVNLGAAGADGDRGLRVGQPVTVNPLWSCGSCFHCARGQPQLCAHRRLLGAHRAGAFAQQVAVPAASVHLLPPGLGPREAALAEPVAVAVHVARLAGDVHGETVLIVGAGPIGLLTLQVVLRQAERVLVADLSPERRAMARTLGAVVLDPQTDDVVQAVRDVTGQLGAAVTVDAVGVAATRAQCIAATRSGGRAMLSGLHEEIGVMPAAEIIRREITVQGSFAYTPEDFAQALTLLAAGEVRLDPWIVEAPLGQGGAWFERLIAAPGDVSKVLLRP